MGLKVVKVQTLPPQEMKEVCCPSCNTACVVVYADHWIIHEFLESKAFCLDSAPDGVIFTCRGCAEKLEYTQDE